MSWQCPGPECGAGFAALGALRRHILASDEFTDGEKVALVLALEEEEAPAPRPQQTDLQGNVSQSQQQPSPPPPQSMPTRPIQATGEDRYPANQSSAHPVQVPRDRSEDRRMEQLSEPEFVPPTDRPPWEAEPVKCPACPFLTSSASSLKYHAKAVPRSCAEELKRLAKGTRRKGPGVVRPRLRECPTCDYVTLSASSLKNHGSRASSCSLVRKSTSPRPCKICHRGYQSFAALRTHYLYDHKVLAPDEEATSEERDDGEDPNESMASSMASEAEEEPEPARPDVTLIIREEAEEPTTELEDVQGEQDSVPVNSDGLKPWESRKNSCSDCPFVAAQRTGLQRHQATLGTCERERRRLAEGRPRNGPAPRRPRLSACSHCAYVTLREQALADHKERGACKGTAGRKPLCSICDDMLPGYAELRRHYERDHWVLPPEGQEGLPIDASQDQTAQNSESSDGSSSKEKSERQLHFCASCAFISLRPGDVEAHFLPDGGCGPLPVAGMLCLVCQAPAPSYATLSQHYQLGHAVPLAKEPCRPPGPSVTSSSSPPVHSAPSADSEVQVVETPSKSTFRHFYRCSRCAYVALAAPDLRRHMGKAGDCDSRQPRKDLKCRQCLLPMSDYASLAQHFVSAHGMAARELGGTEEVSQEGPDKTSSTNEEAPAQAAPASDALDSPQSPRGPQSESEPSESDGTSGSDRDGMEEGLSADEEEGEEEDDHIPLTADGLKPWECPRFKCPSCPYISSASIGFRQHSERPGACDEERRRLASGRKRRGCKPKRPQIHRCDRCPYVALKEDQLRRHSGFGATACQRHVDSRKLVACSICEALQAGYRELQRHYEHSHWVLPPSNTGPIALEQPSQTTESVAEAVQTSEPASLTTTWQAAIDNSAQAAKSPIPYLELSAEETRNKEQSPKEPPRRRQILHCAACTFVTVAPNRMRDHATGPRPASKTASATCFKCHEACEGYSELSRHLQTEHGVPLAPQPTEASHKVADDGDTSGSSEQAAKPTRRQVLHCASCPFVTVVPMRMRDHAEKAYAASDRTTVTCFKCHETWTYAELKAHLQTRHGIPLAPQATESTHKVSDEDKTTETTPEEPREAEASESTDASTKTLKHQRQILHCSSCPFVTVAPSRMREHSQGVRSAAKKSSATCFKCHEVSEGYAELSRHLQDEHQIPMAPEATQSSHRVVPEETPAKAIQPHSYRESQVARSHKDEPDGTGKTLHRCDGCPYVSLSLFDTRAHAKRRHLRVCRARSDLRCPECRAPMPHGYGQLSGHLRGEHGARLADKSIQEMEPGLKLDPKVEEEEEEEEDLEESLVDTSVVEQATPQSEDAVKPQEVAQSDKEGEESWILKLKKLKAEAADVTLEPEAPEPSSPATSQQPTPTSGTHSRWILRCSGCPFITTVPSKLRYHCESAAGLAAPAAKLCPKCRELCEDYAELSRHLQKAHDFRVSPTASEPAHPPVDREAAFRRPPGTLFRCGRCPYVSFGYGDLQRHASGPRACGRRARKDLLCPEAQCRTPVAGYEELAQHLLKEHSAKLAEKTIQEIEPGLVSQAAGEDKDTSSTGPPLKAADVGSIRKRPAPTVEAEAGGSIQKLQAPKAQRFFACSECLYVTSKQGDCARHNQGGCPNLQGERSQRKDLRCRLCKQGVEDYAELAEHFGETHGLEKEIVEPSEDASEVLSVASEASSVESSEALSEVPSEVTSEESSASEASTESEEETEARKSLDEDTDDDLFQTHSPERREDSRKMPSLPSTDLAQRDSFTSCRGCAYVSLRWDMVRRHFEAGACASFAARKGRPGPKCSLCRRALKDYGELAGHLEKSHGLTKETFREEEGEEAVRGTETDAEGERTMAAEAGSEMAQASEELGGGAVVSSDKAGGSDELRGGGGEPCEAPLTSERPSEQSFSSGPQDDAQDAACDEPTICAEGAEGKLGSASLEDVREAAGEGIEKGVQVVEGSEKTDEACPPEPKRIKIGRVSPFER